MSRLAELLEKVRIEYVQVMVDQGETEPYLTAHRVCNECLWLSGEELAALIDEDPKLLSARASDLIDVDRERPNPCVGAIVTSNIVAAALEGLLAVAVNRNWLEVDSEGRVLVDAHELDSVPAVHGVDYTEAGEFAPKRGRSHLSDLFHLAEKAYVERLEDGPHDAYQLALMVASDHAIFTPDELAPLLVENPLLLGLRGDDLLDDDLFEGDPPAGMIISAHLTEMLVQQLLERGVEVGAIGHDGEGQPLLSEAEEDNPTVH
ncbi:hypothetical protein [Marinobacterium lutimaris]|uniref:Uncharacterized protein n=1 Tax=Marinobacterium lutimaris TaxID=568106 RepID=A0A1H5YEL3_9GAMM|nr:hypothetical protein [Marinobacterium lutimaris]SEG22493.1 hypothetical protein SAMN05444390_1011728 [Marinobacterium lutimaris]